MLICPKCKYEYETGVSVCSDCGTTLVEELKDIEINTTVKKDDISNWLKGFGNITAQKAITVLFYLVCIPLFISSIMFGKYIYLTKKYFKDISYMQDGVKWFTQSEVNNLPLAIFLASIYFVFSLLIWKIICELLIIIFRCFETYTQKK